jgi:hypothetical protein
LSKKILLSFAGDDMKPSNRVIWLVALIPFLIISGCSDDKEGANSASGDSVSAHDNISPTPGKKISVKQTAPKIIMVLWDASTDNETVTKDLQYKLIYSTRNNIGTVDSAEKNGTVVMGWTPGTLSRQIKGLSTSNTYYFTALVRDKAGNIAVYMPQTLSTQDSNPPVAKGQVSVSNISKDSIIVSWPPAIDDVTAQENLQYKLLYMPHDSTKMTVNPENSGTLIMDWTANAKSKQVNGLASTNSYYFVVMVKDEAGNKTLYPSQKFSSLDVNAPQVDSGIIVSEISPEGVTVSWEAASDDVTSPDKLQYKVVYSTDRNVDNVSEADSNGQVSLGWTANISTHKVSGLEPSTTYYIVTLVRDEAGNEALYEPREITTTHREEVQENSEKTKTIMAK